MRGARRWFVVALCMAPLLALAAPRQARDASAGGAGTAAIVGVVMGDGAPAQPLARAVVTLGGDGGSDRGAITDDHGAFAIRGLPAGHYVVTAAKRGYLSAQYGAMRPGRPGTAVALNVGQTSAPITIRLSRGSVLTGAIHDASGDPSRGVRVFAVDAHVDPSLVGEQLMTAGRAGGSLAGGVATDDQGHFRLFELPPGEYVILAASTDNRSDQVATRSTAEIDAIFTRLRSHGGTTSSPAASTVSGDAAATHRTMAPVYYPGTSSYREATCVTLGLGDERTGLDFVMSPIAVSTIDGFVVSDGGPVANAELSIVPDAAIHLFALASASPSVTHQPDVSGRFQIGNLAPGHYVVVARANPTGSAESRDPGQAGIASFGGRGGSALPASGDPSRTMYGSVAVDVAGQPVTGVTLRLQPGGRFSGRVVFDAVATLVPADLTKMRVSLAPVSNGGYSVVGGTYIGNAFASARPATPNADGSFEFLGVAPGTYRVTATVLPGGSSWWFRSAIAGGKDLLDAPIEINPGTIVKDAVLTLTDRHSQLSGKLQTGTGQPAPEYVVIVFPSDSTLWPTAARRMQSARPSTDGAFSFGDLPAGDYVLAAVTDVEPDEWKKPAFLNDMAAKGVKVSLGVGEKKIQDLQLARR